LKEPALWCAPPNRGKGGARVAALLPVAVAAALRDWGFDHQQGEVTVLRHFSSNPINPDLIEF